MGTRTRNNQWSNTGGRPPGNLPNTLVAHANRLACSLLSDPGLRIVGGSGSPLAEAQTAVYALVADTLVLVAAGTDMPALSGTVDADDFGLYVWEVDAAGTVTQLTLATASTFAGITFPTLSDDKACVGALLVNPTGTGDFVGGTTDIDDATVVPNAVFFDGHNFGGISNRIEYRETGDVTST